MRPREPRQIGAWSFHMLDAEGNEIQVPSYGALSTLDELHAAVLQYMNIYDGVTENAYTSKQRELAEKHKLSWEDYVRSLIEHQMCVRNKGSIPCWSDGFGDSLHEAGGMIDAAIQVLPEPIKMFMQKSIAKVTPSRSPTLSGCQSCGGTATFNPGTNNLGRAGEVNRILNR